MSDIYDRDYGNNTENKKAKNSSANFDEITIRCRALEKHRGDAIENIKCLLAKVTLLITELLWLFVMVVILSSFIQNCLTPHSHLGLVPSYRKHVQMENNACKFPITPLENILKRIWPYQQASKPQDQLKTMTENCRPLTT